MDSIIAALYKQYGEDEANRIFETLKVDMAKIGNEYSPEFSKLSEQSPAVSAIVPGTNIHLYDHQTRTIAALIVTERGAVRGSYNAAILANDLGSGKSFDMLSLCVLNEPLKSSQYVMYDQPNVTGDVNQLVVKRRYSKRIGSSVIFVSKGVIDQFAKIYEQYLPHRKVLFVRSVHELRAVYAQIKAAIRANTQSTSDEITIYDEIIIKNSTLTGATDFIELRETGLDVGKSRDILSVFTATFRNYMFKRVIIDDFDTLGLNASAVALPARFTWFVSSTKSDKMIDHAQVLSTSNDYIHLIYFHQMYSSACARLVSRTDVSSVLPTVKCSSEFIRKSVNTGRIKFWVYKHVGPNDNMVNALVDMGYGHLAEMINADALGEAAQQAGNSGLTTGGIFRKILQDKHDAYMLSARQLKYCKRVTLHWQGCAIRPLGTDGRVVEFNMPNKLRKNCIAHGPFAELKKIVRWRDNGVPAVVDEVETESRKVNTASGLTIARVKDRFSDGECPITCTPFNECRNIFILDCCQVVISDMAINIGAVKFTRFGDRLQGDCPNCRTRLTHDQIISVNPDYIKDIVEEKVDDANVVIDEVGVQVVSAPTAVTPDDEAVVDEVAADGDAAETPAEPELPESAKYKTFVKIVNGTVAEGDCEEKSLYIAGVIKSNCDKGEVLADARKFLYVSNYESTFKKLEQYFVGNGMRYRVLCGTAHDITESVRRYWLPNTNAESIQVLLINKPIYCAGLNLQNTTDFVFAHWIRDAGIRAQFLGRAQRVGRTSNLNVHTLLYGNEYQEYMFQAQQDASKL